MPETETDRRQRIVDDALRLFSRTSYDATTMADLSRALGMTKGNLYNYFRDKEEILFACHQRSLDALDQLVEQVRASGAAPGTQLTLFVAGFLRVVCEQFGGAILALEVDALGDEHRRLVIARRDAIERSLREVVTQGIAAGDFRPTDPKLVTFAILGASNWAARWWSPGGGASVPDLARSFSDLFLGGLRKPSAGPVVPASLS